MNTGESEQGLRQIIDMTRAISIVLLLLHFYHYCFEAFSLWEYRTKFTDHVLLTIIHTKLFEPEYKPKVAAIFFLMLSMLGANGKNDENLSYKTAVAYLIAGMALYFTGDFIFNISADIETKSILYFMVTITGFIGVLTGGGLLTRIVKNKWSPEVSNKPNETFPQEERLLQNEFSVNLPARYTLKNKMRNSWINFINPMRGLLIIGSPGSGKSYFVIQHIIRQHIEKGFSMFIYDYKYDDLTTLAYNHLLKHQKAYKIIPSFYVINFDALEHSNRSNPLDPANMHDITDAVEAARVILLGLNRSWLKKQGEFFVESPINFLTALIWFLRKYNDGQYCTLPHVIELMQTDIAKLFTILRTEPEIAVYINPFISAFLTNSMEQLEGQLDAAKISMARLSSPALYYILSGNDFSLDINNPITPKIVCLGNNPQKQEVYGPVLSLYITRMTKIINRKNQLKSSIIIDEFTTLTFLGIDTLIATGRSNKISTTLAIQDASQLKLNYGKELADVIINICGNIIVGQANGEIAKQVSERLGKTLQERESISVNSNDRSISRFRQLEYAVPISTISSLSSGEFVGMVADNPEEPINLKTFHSTIINDHEKIKKEEKQFNALPKVQSASEKEIYTLYQLIKHDVLDITESIMHEILNDPASSSLVLKKK
jgi:hypothetical protein